MLWRDIIFAYQWLQWNLEVVIRPKEHTEYNATINRIFLLEYGENVYANTPKKYRI
jgi:hypothetical protein